MRFGIVLRLSGEASQPEHILACARAAESAGLDDLWVADHVAPAPDDAQGADGRLLDPLASLAYLACATTRIGIGTAILVLPYRPALPTARSLATIQELSGGRLSVGVGIGWMKSEFRALGVDRRQRGRIADEALGVFHRCFGAEGGDVVELNDQEFVFRPRPARPRILVGGGAPHALARAAKFGDGWIPMAKDPEALAPQVAELHRRFSDAGRPAPEVVVIGQLGMADPASEHDRVRRLEEIGVTGLVQAGRYPTIAGFERLVAAATRLRDTL